MRTPDQHLETLRDLAGEYERISADNFKDVPELRALYERYAAAIRWALDETAWPVDENIAQ